MVLGLFDSAIPFKGQDFSKLKSQCVSSGQLFEDPEFPPSSSSLFHSKSAPENIVWKRPGVRGILSPIRQLYSPTVLYNVHRIIFFKINGEKILKHTAQEFIFFQCYA